jgi:hypothetical protein
VDPHAHRLIPGVVARRRNVVALRFTERALVVVTADPVTMSELGRVAARIVQFEVAPPGLLVDVVADLYPEKEGLSHELPPLTHEAKGGPHILVVDDDPAIRLLLASMLRKNGFRIDEAAGDFVVKPVDPPRFLLRIKAVLLRRSSDPFADFL